jgi:hypothetical protein
LSVSFALSASFLLLSVNSKSRNGGYYGGDFGGRQGEILNIKKFKKQNYEQKLKNEYCGKTV